MDRLFWLVVGMIMGAAAYHFYRDQGGNLPSWETLQDSGKEMFETAKSRAGSIRSDFQQAGGRWREDVRDDISPAPGA